ncbi:uncharacterized protein LOC144605172 [Rhinoraja longicauda]
MNARLKSREVLILLSLCGQVNSLFLRKPLASSFLSRPRRANVGLEELIANNLRRECMEETCSKEEASEWFKDEQTTEVFWKEYKGSSLRANASEGHGAHAKPELNTTLPTHTTDGGDGLNLSALLEWGSSLRANASEGHGAHAKPELNTTLPTHTTDGGDGLNSSALLEWGSSLRANASEGHGAHAKPELNTTLPTHTTDGGDGLNLSALLEWASSWTEHDRMSILTLGRQILEKQQQVVESRQKRINQKERLVNKTIIFLRHAAWF